MAAATTETTTDSEARQAQIDKIRAQIDAIQADFGGRWIKVSQGAGGSEGHREQRRTSTTYARATEPPPANRRRPPHSPARSPQIRAPGKAPIS